MKNILKILILFIAITAFSGCYTIVWSPEDEFPTSDKQEYYYDSYYSDNYYGDYYYFYDYPWWYNITPPVYNPPAKEYERGSGTTTIRNNGNGRSNETGRDIIQNPPPTRTVDNGNSDNTSKEKSRDTNTTSGNSSGSNNNTSRDNSSDRGSVRNNDGGRNNSGGRR